MLPSLIAAMPEFFLPGRQTERERETEDRQMDGQIDRTDRTDREPDGQTDRAQLKSIKTHSLRYSDLDRYTVFKT